MKNYRWATLGCGVIANEPAQVSAKDGRSLYGAANRTYQSAVGFKEKSGIGLSRRDALNFTRYKTA